MVRHRYNSRVRERYEGTREIAELLGRIGRIAYSSGNRKGLTPAQWTALRFFARANRFSRTVSAFAEFHSTTRGTASQTVKGLVHRGFLLRSESARDGRSSRLDLTDRASALLDEDPLEDVASAVDLLSESTRRKLGADLKRVLGELAERRHRRPFGCCPTCSHREREVLGPRGAEYTCGLVGETLGPAEADRICVNFEPVALAP